MINILKYKNFEGVKYSAEDLYFQEEQRFHFAVGRNDEKSVKMYISRGFDVNGFFPVSKTTRQHIFTPLIQASIKGYVNIMKLLVDAGANVNIVNENKMTAIHYAALNDRADSLKFLIENGANLALKDNSNKYFFDYITSLNSYARKYLQSYSAQKIILSKSPKLYKEFKLFIGKLNTSIEKEFEYLSIGDYLNLI